MANTFMLCGLSKSNEGLKVHDLAAPKSICPVIRYHLGQVCLSCQGVFIVQTIRVILLGPISWLHLCKHR